MAQPVVSRKTYALTFGTLLGLTALTTLLGFVDMGSLNTAVAVGLAGVKACLIGGFFMHGFYESRTIRIAMIAGIGWFLIMISLTLVDYASRFW
jgi:cytochrome c oxidase subunit IV